MPRWSDTTAEPLTIEKGIPIPTTRENGWTGHVSKYAIFGDMEIGDSIAGTKKLLNGAVKYKRAHPEWNYMSRWMTQGEVRIWRIPAEADNAPP
jgi:hypothetical protein